ncbi:MAG: P1 family peptidase, partial [Proteobacteria bacterium]|nr:P1 family peptidase [Pseudomonadota bacterium]
GGGFGATTANLKGGIGSASAVARSGITVAALVVVNAVGSAVIGKGPHFWAAPYEIGNEFGGLGMPPHMSTADRALSIKGAAPPSTTIAVVATDAILTKAQAKRLAIMADDGLARAIRPAHAPMDGDTVFAVATSRKPLTGGAVELTELGMLAGDCLSRAIARGIYEATALDSPGALPAWRDRFQEVRRP